MDRTFVYPGSIPLDTDVLNLNRNVMKAFSALIQATLGSATVIDGLTLSPTTPASMSIQVAPGSITSLTSLDATAYGTLPADTADQIVKMGINLSYSFFNCPAPSTPGTSVIYLLEVGFSETDGNSVVLPYYNAGNPTVPFLGSGNTGFPQPTARIQSVAMQIKAGVAASTGSQVAPLADAGWVGVATVDVDSTTTAIQVANITPLANAPIIPFKLPTLRPGYSSLASFTGSGLFVVPPQVTRAKVTVVGGGGAGGSNATLPGGGGGAGGQAVLSIENLAPGTYFAVTVGAGGVAMSGGFGPGGNGGSSSFGALVSATGGVGGGAAPSASPFTGGNGGNGAGGNINYSGSFGTDGIPAGGRGGDGGGPGAGRGATNAPGVPAPGFGGGGGGGAPGDVGANGAAGLVIVEY